MKNKISLALFGLLASAGLMAQSPVMTTSHNGAQSWQAAQPRTEVPTEATRIIQQILDVLGLNANFDIRAANIGNAAAVNYAGKRYILYNPNFFAELTKTTGNKWAAVSVLAHEIGHHLDGHTASQATNQQQAELEADAFSGFVLRKMGASIDDAQVAMKTASSARGSATHPGKDDRLLAIADGWNKADAQLTGKPYVARVQPKVQPAQQNTASVAAPLTQAVAIDPRSIIGSVRFRADASNTYYITSRLNLISVRNGGVNVIGKIAQLNSTRFPFMIYDEANTQLLVDYNGNIVTKEGQLVGKMTKA